MPMNMALKIAIVKSRRTQVAIAEAAGLHDSYLSYIVHGHRKASEAQERAIARALKCKRSDLFPSSSDAQEAMAS